MVQINVCLYMAMIKQGIMTGHVLTITMLVRSNRTCALVSCRPSAAQIVRSLGFRVNYEISFFRWFYLRF